MLNYLTFDKLIAGRKVKENKVRRSLLMNFKYLTLPLVGLVIKIKLRTHIGFAFSLSSSSLSGLGCLLLDLDLQLPLLESVGIHSEPVALNRTSVLLLSGCSLLCLAFRDWSALQGLLFLKNYIPLHPYRPRHIIGVTTQAQCGLKTSQKHCGLLRGLCRFASNDYFPHKACGKSIQINKSPFLILK